jgi:hypothetical protein
MTDFATISGALGRRRLPRPSWARAELRGWAEQTLSYLSDQQFAAEAEGPAVTDFELASRGSRCRRIAQFTNVGGGDPAEVLPWLEKSLSHLEGLLAGKGATTRFPVRDLDLPEGPVLLRIDSSLCNPVRARQAQELAWILGDSDRIRQVASLAPREFDPDSVSSESRTIPETAFHLARACASLAIGMEGPARLALDASTAAAGTEVPWETIFARAILSGSGKAYVFYLREHLRSRRDELADEDNIRDPEFFLALSALAFSALALRRGVAKPEDLPDTWDHPLALLEHIYRPGEPNART